MISVVYIPRTSTMLKSVGEMHMGKFNQAAVVQLDRTLVYETEGQELESLQPRQQIEWDINSDIDQENGQCCCGEYNCNEEYVHWTSGW